MEALMPGSAGGDVAPRPLGQRTAISIKGLTPGVAYHLAQLLPPDPRRPHRRPAPRGRGDRGPRHRLRQAGQRDRCRLARPRLGRRIGRRHGAAGVILRDVPGALGDNGRNPRRQGRQHRQPAASPTATAASTPSTSTSRSTTSRTCTRSSPRLRAADRVSQVERI